MNAVLRFPHPVKKIIHELMDKTRRRSHKNAPISAEYTFFTATEIAGFFYNISGHDAVIFFQIFYAVWIDLGKLLIGGIGIFYFLNFL